jgi:hypothetical protein
LADSVEKRLFEYQRNIPGRARAMQVDITVLMKNICSLLNIAQCRTVDIDYELFNVSCQADKLVSANF